MYATRTINFQDKEFLIFTLQLPFKQDDLTRQIHSLLYIIESKWTNVTGEADYYWL